MEIKSWGSIKMKSLVANYAQGIIWTEWQEGA